MIDFLIELHLDFIPDEFFQFKYSIFLINESAVISDEQAKKLKLIQNLEHLPKADYFYIRTVSDLHKGITIGKILNKFTKVSFFTVSVEKCLEIVPNYKIFQFPSSTQFSSSLQSTDTGECNSKKLKLTRRPYDPEDYCQPIQSVTFDPKKAQTNARRPYFRPDDFNNYQEIKAEPSVQHISRPSKPKPSQNHELCPGSQEEEDLPKVIRYVFNQEKEQLEITKNPSRQVIQARPQVTPQRTPQMLHPTQATSQPTPQPRPQMTRGMLTKGRVREISQKSPETDSPEFFQLVDLIKEAKIEKCSIFYEVHSAVLSYYAKESRTVSFETVEKTISRMIDYNILTFPNRVASKDLASFSMNDQIKIKL